MAPKPKKAAGKKESAKESAKTEKVEKKSAKAAKADAAAEPPKVEGAAPEVDPDEAEEQADEAAAAANGGGGNAAALAAASGTEMSASFKNFRHHPDMENFYRFIYENDLRHEALAILDEMMREKLARRATKGGSKAQASQH